MKKNIFILTLLAIFLSSFGFAFAQQTPTVSATPEPKQDSKKKRKTHKASDVASPTGTPTDTPTPAPKWIPAPMPKDDARNLSFDIYSTYKDDIIGSNLFSIGDLYAKRKLDEYSVTTDFQVRFFKNLSTNDNAQVIDLRIAKITYIEPWLQFSIGRFDIFSVLTPMSFFGAYPDMGIHRVDGAMIVLPINFNIGIQNFQQAQAPPLALTVFYTPSILQAGDVVLDTQQALLITQLRARFKLMNIQTTLRANLAWSGADYFTYSSLNGGMAGSIAVDAALDTDVSIYGEFGDQNINVFGGTDVVAFGAKIQGIGTWGPLSLDNITIEGQQPIETDPQNIFSGANNFYPALSTPGQLSWFGSVKARIKAVSITLAVTNNQDDFTFNRVTKLNSSIPFAGQFGPGRELDRSQIPFQAASYSQPGFLVAISTDF